MIGLEALSPFRAKLIRQVYGIGCTKKSVWQIARALCMPRRRLDEVRRAALADLEAAARRPAT